MADTSTISDVPSIAFAEAPIVSTDEMRGIERRALNELRLSQLQMMELAGAQVARLAMWREPDRIAVLAGKGGNGGDALVAARRLHGWGLAVDVFLSRPAEHFGAVVGHQYDLLNGLGLRLQHDLPLNLEGYDLIIDGLIGRGLNGPLSEMDHDLISMANASGAWRLAVDLPTGNSFQADATLCLGALKTGVVPHASPYGTVYLADIGLPPRLLKTDVFAKGDLLAVTT